MDRVIYVTPYIPVLSSRMRRCSGKTPGGEMCWKNHSNVDHESSEEFKPMQLAAETDNRWWLPQMSSF